MVVVIRLCPMRACTVRMSTPLRGLLDPNQSDPLSDQEPVLAGLTAASIQGTAATGQRAGRRHIPDPRLSP